MSLANNLRTNTPQRPNRNLSSKPSIQNPNLLGSPRKLEEENHDKTSTFEAELLLERGGRSGRGLGFLFMLISGFHAYKILAMYEDDQEMGVCGLSGDDLAKLSLGMGP